MPDEQGHPLPGEDGYVAYQESLKNPTPENQNTETTNVPPADVPTIPQEKNVQIPGQSSPPEATEQQELSPVEDDTIPGEPVVLGNETEPFTDHAEITEGWHAGHNDFYQGSPVINPENPAAEVSVKDWASDVNRENR